MGTSCTHYQVCEKLSPWIGVPTRAELQVLVLTARDRPRMIDPMTARAILFNAAGRVRAGWRVSVFFMLVFILGPLGSLLTRFLYRISVGTTPTSEGQGTHLGSLAFVLLAYSSLIGGTLLASAICLRWLDRRPFRSLGYRWRERGWLEYVIGFGLAAMLITMVVLAEISLGHLNLTWEGQAFGNMLRGTLTALLVFTVAAAFEESLFRGYPLQTLLLDVRPAIAVSVPSLLFGLGHAGNPHASALGIANTVLAGVWLSIAYLKTSRLWLPIGLHAGWNFTLSAVYGLTVSGIEERIGTSLFRAVQAGPTWLTGGRYGPEGGVLVTIVLSGASLWLWRTAWIRPARDASALSQPDAP